MSLFSDAGTEVTLGITDNSGNTAYSSPVTITEGNDVRRRLPLHVTIG